MGTKILMCSCKHEFQDKTYGKGMRVHNSFKPKETGRAHYRCTVCRHEQEVAKKEVEDNATSL